MKHNHKFKSQCIMLLLACGALPLLTRASDTGSVLANGNTADGSGVLFSLTSGIANSGFGFQSLFHDNSGSYNTATGYRALFSNTTGASNTADGLQALYLNTTGIRNTALGTGTLFHNNGSNNTATGWAALFNNTSGFSNTATGNLALGANTTGHDNSAFGVFSLASNTTGNANTAVGQGALQQNTQGFDNTAVGRFALFANAPGTSNTAVGVLALGGNAGGVSNTAVGRGAGQNITGNNNICIGAGVSGVAGENNTIRIGDINLTNASCYIAGLFATSPAATVHWDPTTGQLGSTASSRRFKHDIKPMDKASEAILALKPVTFHYKGDAKNTQCFGLIAEDVEKIDPDLVVRDKDGKAYSVLYDHVNAMLLNEFLKEHRKLQEQQATIADLKSIVGRQEKKFQAKFAQQQKQIEALTTAVQKVNDRIELASPPTRVAVSESSNE